jgi:SAM-dependent methyltransferase
MESLHLIKLRLPEDEAAPEFQYLFEHLVQEAGRGYSHLRVTVVHPGEDIEPPDGPGDVLTVGADNVLLRSPSLIAMRERLRAGAELVVPTPVATVIAEGDLPLYTLSDFEEVEKRWLARADSSIEAESFGRLPVALWSGEAFRRVVSGRPVARALVGRELLDRLDEAPRIDRAGLYHAFIDYYGELRSDVLSYLPEVVEDVLEIGCGRGLTGRLIRDRLGCRVTGVELNPVIALEAEQNLDRVIVGDVSEVEIEGSYDAVIALELMEHLVEPGPFLRSIRRLVKDGGRIVLSVPNVGHYSVVEDLLAGRWDYLPIGLLCYTHLRFFTRQTLDDWLGRFGFEEYEIVPQRTELPPQFDGLGPEFEVDLESLSTKGFYLILHC